MNLIGIEGSLENKEFDYMKSFTFEVVAVLINLALLHYYIAIEDWYDEKDPAVNIHHTLFLKQYTIL